MCFFTIYLLQFSISFTYSYSHLFSLLFRFLSLFLYTKFPSSAPTGNETNYLSYMKTSHEPLSRKEPLTSSFLRVRINSFYFVCLMLSCQAFTSSDIRRFLSFPSIFFLFLFRLFSFSSPLPSFFLSLLPARLSFLCVSIQRCNGVR